MRLQDAHRTLVRRGWLAEIEPRLATAVLDAGRLRTLYRGEALYRPDDEPGGMFGVVDGGIVLSTVGRDGLPTPGHVMRPCTWFGYGSVLHRQRRVLIAEANEPTVILHVPLVELNRLREEHPDAGRAIGQLAMLGEAIYLAIVTDLLIPGADRRLAAVLLRVTGTEGPHLRGTPPDHAAAAAEADPRGVALTQALLADLANASRHTVARFVDRAGRAGWLDWRYGRVRIRDAEALAAFAAGR